MTRVAGKSPDPWQPMQRAVPVPVPPERVAELRAMGADDAMIAELGTQEMWVNNVYVVIVERFADTDDVAELSIRRQDRRAVHDWRDFQRIKSEIAGREAEGVEIYPAESRLMDTANQYYMYCLPPGVEFPFGQRGRNLRDTGEGPTGSVQRPLPDDWKDPDDESH